MQYHHIGESKTLVRKLKEKTKIAGILATPRISRNNVLYFPEELAKQHGKIVPVDLEHNHERTIGYAKLSWNRELQRLEYVGEISDHSIENQLQDGVEYHTSLEGGCASEEVCSATACHTACVGEMNISRMALVIEPGIPETSVNVVESGSSLNALGKKSKPLSQETITKETKECNCHKEMDGDGSHDCPEGKKWDADAGKCVDKESAKEALPVEEIKSMLSWFRTKKESAEAGLIDRDSTLGKKANEVVTQTAFKAEERHLRNTELVGKAELEAVINPAIAELKEMNKQLKEQAKIKEVRLPTATVAQGAGTSSWRAVIESKRQDFTNLAKGLQSSMGWIINKNEFLKENLERDPSAPWGRLRIKNRNTPEHVMETVTATNVPAITFQRRIVFDPSGISNTPVRQYLNVQTVGEGTNQVNFYSGDATGAAFADITVGTAMTDQTLTVTRSNATLDHTGELVKVGYPDLHDIPGDVMAHLNEALALRAIQNEGEYVYGTDTGGWAASGFTPTNWVRGDTGATITAENVASVAMKRDGIVHAKKKISQQGFDISPGAQVTILDPEPYAELLLDTNLNNYYQYARPDITAQGVLETIYGCDIVPSANIPFNDDTNDMWRNVMLTKGITNGLGVGQELEFEADRRNEVSQVFVTARHRLIGARILEKSGCRISTTKS